MKTTTANLYLQMSQRQLLFDYEYKFDLSKIMFMNVVVASIICL
jgi:hypothetical protein